MGRSLLASCVGAAAWIGAAVLAAAQEVSPVQPTRVRPAAPPAAPVSLPDASPEGASSRLETAVFALG
jgi:hypothetical protein